MNDVKDQERFGRVGIVQNRSVRVRQNDSCDRRIRLRSKLKDGMLSTAVTSINQSESALLPNQITVDRAQLSELDEILVNDRNFHSG